MKPTTPLVLPVVAAALGLALAGCNESHDQDGAAHSHEDGSTHEDHGPGDSDPGHDNDGDAGHGDSDTHTHADGSTHDAHDTDPQGHTDPQGEHAHHDDEVDLDPATIGGMTVALAQGHGAVEAGKEGHLIVKLPYNDNGATVVRAWIGTDDRTLSFVGKGDYAPSHDDYDIHAMAPDPLPENTMWWIEIEKPDGTKVVGSATPILE
ncbi:MAG: hypothetical protein NCW75_04820 [Phycisphaera sp.]|nr:MAG: hypothetical protein NCW75_04820 [Phycisphaera sp.]